jgi:AmmeMemoRadiSam system protein B
VRGLIAPHIDLLRGGHCYAWAYHALAQACDSDLFIILGTVHLPTEHFFTATAKDFQTPLGILRSDRDFVNALASRCGERLFQDEFTHKIEHTIELQVLFLQHLLGPSSPARIAPVLCSSFLEAAKDRGPGTVPEVQDFVAAMKEAIASCGQRVCLIASADLAHVGPQFGDPRPLSPGVLSIVESDDREMLKYAERVDAEGFFRAVARDNDPRRICGLPPIYVFLSAIGAADGKLLKYAQAADPAGHSCVTFAAMAFY